jgi:hypothetical protein
MRWIIKELGFDCLQGHRYFSFPLHPDRLCGSPAHYLKGNKALFTSVKQPKREATTHLNLVSRLICFDLHLHSPIRLEGVVLN